MMKVSVKWQKDVFTNVEIDTKEPTYLFKCKLFDLTGVPPERQKIIVVKGVLLKDLQDWSTVEVKEGQKLLLVGTAYENVTAPVLAEDKPEEEQGHSAGLVNLGNTCYMNSTVQCLHSVPELKSALTKYDPLVRSNVVDQSSHELAVTARELFGELDKSFKAVTPLRFLAALQAKYPQFAQAQNGIYMQQDAEECWSQLLCTLSTCLKSPNSSDDPADTVKRLFGIDLVSRVHCAESGEESTETELVYSLKCHTSQEVCNLHEGLKHALKSKLEKDSPSLGRSAIYLKDSRINNLPRYLTVHFVRFFWIDQSNEKTKILRKVDYPLELDVYDFCSDDLRKRLDVPRWILKDEEAKKFGVTFKERFADIKMIDVAGPSSVIGDSSNAVPAEGGEKHLTGVYDLVAVLTHKGRTADSGHNVAWVKQENGNWIKFDDDNLTSQKEEDITHLSGGGDEHMAQICLYKAGDVTVTQPFSAYNVMYSYDVSSF